jgi:hypothetical protein
MIDKIDVDAPIADEEELEVEDDVRVEVGEEDADLVYDQMEPNNDMNEQGSIVPSSGDAVGIRCEAENLASVLLKPTNLIALMLTSETQRFTREQFEEHSRVVEICSKGGPREMRYPYYTTLKTKVEPCAIEFAYAGSFIRKFLSSQSSLNRWKEFSLKVPIDSTGPSGQATENKNQSRAGESGSERPVVIVPPSQWALLDVSTGPVFRLMFSDKKALAAPIERALFDTIEDCPIVRDRERIMNFHSSMCATLLSHGTACDGTSRPEIGALPVPVFSDDSLQVTISDRKKPFDSYWEHTMWWFRKTGMKCP